MDWSLIASLFWKFGLGILLLALTSFGSIYVRRRW